MEDKIVTRYCVPSKFDASPHGTICRVMGETSNDSKFYIQTKDQINPVWVEWGEFLGTALHDLVSHEAFVSECLKLYTKVANKDKVISIVLDK